MNAVLSCVIGKFSLHHPAPAFASAAFGIPEFLSNVNNDNDYIQHRNNNDYIQHRNNNDYIQHRQGQLRTAIPDPTLEKDQELRRADEYKTTFLIQQSRESFTRRRRWLPSFSWLRLQT